MHPAIQALHDRAKATAARYDAAGANTDRVNRYCGRAEVIITRHAARLGELIPTLYVQRRLVGGYLRDFLTTWPGQTVAPLELRGEARGFNRTKLYCYSATIEGRRYYGRGLGPGMYLNLRPAAR